MREEAFFVSLWKSHSFCSFASTMVKSCCAVGCSNRSKVGSVVSFYRFPADPVKRKKWTVAVRRDKWSPNQNTWLCSAHFVGGKKSDDLWRSLWRAAIGPTQLVQTPVVNAVITSQNSII
eukprot:scpid40809/ scgid7514/ THAP domain-containing protein 4